MSAQEQSLTFAGEPRAAARPALSHANNFDALRLGAALLVLLSHQFFFLGRPQPAPLDHTLGELAVMVFFTVSGYLVTESWYRDPHLMRFAARRLLRLWPALAAATVLIAVAGGFLTRLPVRDYPSHATARFVTDNLRLRVVYELPGVFVTQPHDKALSAVNGSWWSIPLEVKCYLYLAALGLIGLRRRWFALLALGAVAWQLRKHDAVQAIYVVCFLSGVCARQFADELRRYRRPLQIAGVAGLALALGLHAGGLAEWLIVVPGTLIAGSAATPALRSAGRFGDLSYGIYLYAYFTQQLVLRLWPDTPPFTAAFVLSAAATCALAWGSWHAVEAPALGMKRRLRHWFPDRLP